MRQDGPLATIPAVAGFRAGRAQHRGLALCALADPGRHSPPGQDVLVNGATGGIGSAAVQLAKGLGATVTGVCGPAHLELVTRPRRRSGDRLHRGRTSPRTAGTYDVVIDAVGKSTFGACRPVLRAHGIYLSSELGPVLAEPRPRARHPAARAAGRSCSPFRGRTRSWSEYLKGLIEAGTFRPLVDRHYPLDEIVDAYATWTADRRSATW